MICLPFLVHTQLLAHNFLSNLGKKDVPRSIELCARRDNCRNSTDIQCSVLRLHTPPHSRSELDYNLSPILIQKESLEYKILCYKVSL